MKAGEAVAREEELEVGVFTGHIPQRPASHPWVPEEGNVLSTSSQLPQHLLVLLGVHSPLSLYNLNF